MSTASPLHPPPPPFTFTPQTATAFLYTNLIPTLQSSIERVASFEGCMRKRSEILIIQRECIETYLSEISDGNVDVNDGVNAFKLIADMNDVSVLDAVHLMNLTLRETYINSLLFSKPEANALKSEGEMTKSETLDFLDACVGQISLKSTRDKLREYYLNTGLNPNALLIDMQDEMLECIGIEKDFGIVQLNLIRVRFGEDKGVLEKLEEFSSVIESACKAAMSKDSSSSSNAYNNDDVKDDGTTRVVSTTFHADIDPSIPTTQGMQSQLEAEAKNNFAMAKKASELQQGILAELLGMDEDQRRAMLNDAKVTHDAVISSVMQLSSFSEKTGYMQLLNAETQRDLIMHKMWEKFVQDNGGVELVIEKFEGLGADED